MSVAGSEGAVFRSGDRSGASRRMHLADRSRDRRQSCADCRGAGSPWADTVEPSDRTAWARALLSLRAGRDGDRAFGVSGSAHELSSGRGVIRIRISNYEYRYEGQMPVSRFDLAPVLADSMVLPGAAISGE